MNAPGAGAFHAAEFGAGRQLHPRFVQAQQKHNIVLFAAFHLRHRAAMLAISNMAHPRQGTAHRIAAGHFFGAQQHRLDIGPGFHRIGKRGAAKGFAIGVVAQHLAAQRRIVAGVQIKAAHLVRPSEKAGGAAGTAHDLHGIDGGIEARALALQMGGKRPGLPQLGHDFQRVMAAVDAVCQGLQVLPGNGVYSGKQLGVGGRNGGGEHDVKP